MNFEQVIRFLLEDRIERLSNTVAEEEVMQNVREITIRIIKKYKRVLSELNREE